MLETLNNYNKSQNYRVKETIFLKKFFENFVRAHEEHIAAMNPNVKCASKATDNSERKITRIQN